MNTSNLRINTQSAKSLNQKEWHEVIKLVKKFKNNLNKDHDYKYFINKLVKNPYGDSYITRALDSEGNCIGLATYTKKLFLNTSVIFPCFEYGDVYLEKKWQGRFIFSKIIKNGTKLIQKKYQCLIYGTPNNIALPWYLRNDFKKVDYSIYSYVLPTKVEFKKEIKFLKFFWKSINLIWIIIIKMILYFYSINCKITTKEKNIIHENNFYQNHDIQLNKDDNYINWRYNNNPHNYKIFEIIDKQYNFIIGFIVFRENETLNGKNLYIVDFDLKKSHCNKIHKILSIILLKNFSLQKYNFIYVWISSKSLFFYSFKKILPLKTRLVNFIIFNNKMGYKFMKVKNKLINYVIGDGDNY